MDGRETDSASMALAEAGVTAMRECTNLVGRTLRVMVETNDALREENAALRAVIRRLHGQVTRMGSDGLSSGVYDVMPELRPRPDDPPDF